MPAAMPDADAAYKNAHGGGNPAPRVVDAYGRFLERSGATDEASALYAKVQATTRPAADRRRRPRAHRGRDTSPTR